jgi:protein tyrosine phosphatase (PTP) superfamily phosphohydrolase (DUF442 family)
MAVAVGERPAVEPPMPSRSRWPRRIRIAVFVVLAATIGALLQGNLALIAASWWARSNTELDAGPKLDGVRKLYVVDDRLWRGAQPGTTGFRSLAESGVTTVIDLRPGSDSSRVGGEIRALRMESVHLPVTDGTPPSPRQVRRVVDIVDNSHGRVFLHCGEGVGRAGTMSAAYKVTTGNASASEALRESLAIGVLTFEQITFIRSLDRDGAHDPPVVATAFSRFLDAPRQLFNQLV